jgi:hypothetical protein
MIEYMPIKGRGPRRDPDLDRDIDRQSLIDDLPHPSTGEDRRSIPGGVVLRDVPIYNMFTDAKQGGRMPKDRQIGIRLTEDQFTFVELIASEKEMTISEYIRYLIAKSIMEYAETDSALALVQFIERERP